MTSLNKGQISIYPKRLNLVFVFLCISVASLIANLYFYSSYNHFHIIYAAGSVAVFLGSLLVDLIMPSSGCRKYKIYIIKHTIFLSIFKLLSFVGLLIVVYVFYAYGFKFNVDGAVIDNLRHAKTVESLNFYGLGYFGLLSLIVAVSLKFDGEKKKSLLYFSLAISTSIASAERTSLLYFFVMYFGVDYFLKEKISMKYLMIPIVIIMAMFFIIAFYTNKLLDVDGHIFILSYFAYPLEALRNLDISSLKLPLTSVFGIVAMPMDNIFASVTSVPDEVGVFNVYSYIYRPIVVLGLNGFLILMFLIGILFSVIERGCRHSAVYLVVKLSILFSVIMIFYDWTFNLTTHLYVLILAFLALGRYKFSRTNSANN